MSKGQIVLTNREAGIALVLLASVSERIDKDSMPLEWQAVLLKVKAGVEITPLEDGICSYETRFTIQAGDA